jgi:hypothetical protein
MDDSEFVLPPPGFYKPGQPNPQGIPPVGRGASGGMGDLPEAIRYRTLRKEAVGPLNAPIDIQQNCLEYLCYMMELLLKRFAWYPRNTLSFVAPSTAPVAVAAGATATIAQFQMPQDKLGVLMKVGWDCSVPASLNLVTWTLVINGAAHPFFNNLVFATSNLANADEFVVPLGMNALIQLQATNFNLGPVTLNGIMRGFVLIESDPSQYSGI